MAGTLGAVEHLAWIGRAMAKDAPGEGGRRGAIKAAWGIIGEYEAGLTRQLVTGLEPLPGITIRGIADPARLDRRVPTVSFTHDHLSPVEICARLADEGIFVWSGHNFAVEVIRTLGLLEKGGVLRVGLAHYNTRDEVDALLLVLGRITRQQ
jgi:selenocysteine lyase/cysteine desulfurase